MRDAYQAILQLYPAEYRAIFAPEMLQTFQEAAIERRGRGRAAFLRFAVRELTGLLGGLSREWRAKWTAQDGYMSSHSPFGLGAELPTDMFEIQRRLRRVIGCMEFAIANHDFPKARLYCEEERVTREHLERLKREYDVNHPILT